MTGQAGLYKSPKVHWNLNALKAYEAKIATLFNEGKIKAPVHLAGGNERQLIEIFKNICVSDWVLCSWRSHYHCLLKGVREELVTEAIIRGRSIALCFPHNRILSSAIVGGIAPIAIGLAWSIKQKGLNDFVHVFLGDMTANSGVVYEAINYASGHDLPIYWYIEDNGLSVSTPTRHVWGNKNAKRKITRFKYDMTVPHVGTGKFVKF